MQCRRPIHIHPQTLERSKNKIGRVEDISFFDTDETFTIEDLTFDPIPTSHDAISPVGFSVYSNGIKTGIVTDLGVVTNLVVEKLKASDILIIESNHDEELLIDGPYPWYLKQRIKSNKGHLSNVQSNELLEKIWHDGIKHLFLAHLSMVNNIPQIAEFSTVDTIKKITNCDKFSDIVMVTDQFEPTCPVEI